MATFRHHLAASRNRDAAPPPAILESVGMVFRLLDQLVLARGPLGITQLSDLLEEPKPRVYRHLASMRQLGIVEQDMETEKYRLGARLLVYGQAAEAQFDLRAIADPYLTRLRDATGQSAILSVTSNGTALVVASADALSNVFVSVKPGNRLLPHCTAQGRIVLAFSDTLFVDRVLSRPLESFSDSTITKPDALRQRLDLIHKRLWDIAEGETIFGITALAAPIFRNENTIAGTIGIVGTSTSIPNPPPASLVQEVQAVAAEISRRLNNNTYASLLPVTDTTPSGRSMAKLPSARRNAQGTGLKVADASE